MFITREEKIKKSNKTYFEVSWCSSPKFKSGFKIYASKKWANRKVSQLMKKGIDMVTLYERESKFDVLQKEFTFYHSELN